MAFTPSELALWLRSAENLDAVCALVTSGDLKLVECVGGTTVLRTPTSHIVTRLEVGSALILPATSD
jgi:hypothetical protein